MAGIVLVFICIDEWSIYTFLDLAFDLVDSVLSGGVWMPSYHRPIKLWFGCEANLDQYFATEGVVQRSNNLRVFLDELTETGIKVDAPPFRGKISLSVVVALPFFMLLDAHHRLTWQLIQPVVVILLGIGKGVYLGCVKLRDSHLLIILSSFLDLAFDLVDLVFSGRVWMPSYQSPIKLSFEFEVHLDQHFASEGWEQHFKNLRVFLNDPTEQESGLMPSVWKKNPPPRGGCFFSLLLDAHHRLRWQLIQPVLLILLGRGKGLYPRMCQAQGQSSRHHLPCAI